MRFKIIIYLLYFQYVILFLLLLINKNPFREVCETPPQELPSHDTGGAKKWCDICIKKGVKKAAVIYCKQCDKKYCTKHEEVGTACICDLH